MTLLADAQPASQAVPDWFPDDLVAAFEKAMLAAMAAARKATISRLRLHAGPAPIAPPAAHATVAAGGDVPVNPDAFDEGAWKAAIAAQGGPVIEQAIRAGADNALIGYSFDVYEPGMTAAVAEHVAAMQDWTPELRAHVKDIVSASMEAGDSVETTVRKLTRDPASPLSTDRAREIARTEMIAAANRGTLDGARVIGMQTKEWLATNDLRTRPTHRAASGQQVPIDGEFTVGGYPLRYPGDPRAPIQERIRCRCTVLYIEPGEPPGDATATTDPASQSPLTDVLEGDDAYRALMVKSPFYDPAKALDTRASSVGDIERENNSRFSPGNLQKMVDIPNGSGIVTALDRYSGTGFRQVRAELLGQSPMTATGRETVEALDAFLDAQRLPTNVRVYRGLDPQAAWKVDADHLDDLIGQRFSDKSYMSTSVSRLRAEGYSPFHGPDTPRIVLDLEVPEGTPGALLPYGEKEVLLARGGTYEVASISEILRDEEGNAYRLVRARWLDEQAVEAAKPLAVGTRPGIMDAPSARLVYDTPKVEQMVGHLARALDEIHGVNPDDTLGPVTVKYGGKTTTNKGGYFAPHGVAPSVRRRRGESNLDFYNRRDAALAGPFPPEIKLTTARHNEGAEAISFLHEHGHRIDYTGSRKGFASADAKLSVGQVQRDAWEEFFGAVTGSRTWANSRQMILTEAQDARYWRYYSSPEEVWARAYAQWAATKLGRTDVALMRSFETARAFKSPGHDINPRFWADDEFVRIGAAVERVLKARGLML